MDTTNLEKMVELAEKLSGQEALGVIRCINAALCLVNSAEVQHRLRNIKTQELETKPGDVRPGPLYSKEDSVKGSLYALLDNEEASPEEIYEQLCSQSVEIVLTAHPTEVNRKSVLRKYRIASELLAYLERSDLLPFERMQATDDLERIISSLWGMDEIRRNKPTPQKEAAGGLAIIESVLWEAVPAYLRKLDAQCDASLGKRLPLDSVPIKFASWIGGKW
jgi:phosphoenolpyruvate carboxylase